MALVQRRLVLVGLLVVTSLVAAHPVLQAVTGGIPGNDVSESSAQKFDGNNMMSEDTRTHSFVVSSRGESESPLIRTMVGRANESGQAPWHVPPSGDNHSMGRQLQPIVAMEKSRDSNSQWLSEPNPSDSRRSSVVSSRGGSEGTSIRPMMQRTTKSGQGHGHVPSSGDIQLMGGHRQPTVAMEKVRDLDSQWLSDPNPSISSGSRLAQIFVLTTDSHQAQHRMTRLTAAYEDNLTTVHGLNTAGYHSEDEIFHDVESLVHVTSDMKNQWATNPRLLEKEFLQLHRSFGSLACRLGHQRIWMSVRELPADKWAVILEDDATPSARVASWKLLADYIDRIPEGVDIAFLGERHCNGRRGIIHDIHGYGSAAYAITSKMARELLALPFNDFSDDTIIKPVNAGKVAGFCAVPEFAHDDEDVSTMVS